MQKSSCEQGKSYEQAGVRSTKKAEGKKRKSPKYPYREKGKGKENGRGSIRTVLRACAGARVSVKAALDAELDRAAAAFLGAAHDRRIWAKIALRVGVEEFHYAVMDKIAEDQADGMPRRPAAAFQAFLNRRFPRDASKGGAE